MSANSVEVTRRYATKNWVTVQLEVFGNHSFQRLGSSEAPMSTKFYFRSDSSVHPINIYKNSQGTIAFSIALSYAYYYEGAMTHSAHRISSGSSGQHRCSFDYIFPANANGLADLTIGKIVKTRGDDGGHDGDPAYSAELAEWNDDEGAPNGPRYIRIDPSVKYSTGSEHPPQTRDDEGIGVFTISIHAPKGSIIFDGPNRGATIAPIE